jgi:hypothetical protein
MPVGGDHSSIVDAALSGKQVNSASGCGAMIYSVDVEAKIF